MKLAILFIFSALSLTACKQNQSKEAAGKNTISPKMAETLKQAMKKDLVGSDIQKTNDIEKYCDCIVSNLQSNFTTQEIMEAEFTDTKKYKAVKDTCLKSTKLP